MITFNEWFATLGGGYSSYESLLHECWGAATESAAKVVDDMAAYEEKEREPSSAVRWTLSRAAEIRENK